MSKKSNTASEILRRQYANDAEYAEMLAGEREVAQVSQAIYDARIAAGLSQKELAQRIGTSQPAIARLEDGDYDRHSISVLRRIANALNLRLNVSFAAPDEAQINRLLAKVGEPNPV